MLHISLLFAHWRAFGEKFCTPENWEVELRNRGHEVQVYNLYNNGGEIDPRRKTRLHGNVEYWQLCNNIRAGMPCDMVYVLDYGIWQERTLNHEMFPNQVLVKEAGDEWQSHKFHRQTAHQFDIVLTPDKRCEKAYRIDGINAHWSTHFADTRWFFPRPEVPIQHWAVTSTGPRGNGLTEEIKAALGDEFYNDRYFYGHDHGIHLSKGRMVWHKSQWGEICRRIFEGAASKRMVITDRLDPSTGLQDLFQEDQDIVYYNDAQDCINKIRYYASHDEERERIALNGYNKVLKEHTVKNRVDQLLELCCEVKPELREKL